MRIDFKDILLFVISSTAFHRCCGLKSFSVGSVIHSISDDNDWLINKSQWNLDFFYGVFQLVLSIFDQGSVNFLQIFHFFSKVITLIRFLEVISGNVDNFVCFVVSEWREKGFIERIISQNNLIALFLESLDEGREGKNSLIFTTNVVDMFLSFFHSGDVIIEWR